MKVVRQDLGILCSENMSFLQGSLHIICACAFFFQTNMISLDNLTKVIDPTQLTREFDGTLDYDHEQWIQLRLVSIDLTMQQIQESACMNKAST